MRDHERAVVILVRVRRVVAQRVRLAVGRVVERGCRGGAHHDDTVTFFPPSRCTPPHGYMLIRARRGCFVQYLFGMFAYAVGILCVV